MHHVHSSIKNRPTPLFKILKKHIKYTNYTRKISLNIELEQCVTQLAVNIYRGLKILFKTESCVLAKQLVKLHIWSTK